MPDILANYSTWLHTLPVWSQPIITTAIPCFPVLLLLMIRHRVSLHRKGERFTAHKTKPGELLGVAAVFAALYYARNHYALAAQILTWPARTFPLWHRHGGAMTVGFMAAGLVARALSALFAALFLRGGGGRSGVGMGGFQPVAPPAYVARVWHRSTRTTWEDE